MQAFIRNLVLIPAVFAACCACAVDDDKSGLFNTFYLDAEHGDYILVLRENKTFDLYGPGGKHINGTARASAEHVTLTSGEIKRFFHFDIVDRNLKLGRRETDKLTKGDMLGTLPPTTDTRETWMTESHWVKKGHKVFKAPATGAVGANPPPDEAPAIRPAVAAPAPAGAADFADIAGAYSVTSDGITDTLVIGADGRFSYTPPGGTKQSGTVQRTDDELSFLGEKHTRRLSVRRTANGLELTRRETDVLKAGDAIGTMPPTDRTPLIWKKNAPAVRLPEDGGKRDGTDAAKPAPAISDPAPAVASQPVQPAAQPKAAAVPVRDVKTVVGTYVHKANPFIAETLTISDDGTFTYKDSNGAAAAGKVSIENEILLLTSGEVIRRFKASTEDNILVLNVDSTDKPTYKNDLASMSPTVLKVAKYEKK